MDVGLLNGKMAVITDEDGIVSVVVREGDECSLVNLCHLAEENPSIWDYPSVVDDPQVREALGLPVEVERRDLLASSRPKDLPKPLGKEMVGWSMKRLREWLNKHLSK